MSVVIKTAEISSVFYRVNKVNLALPISSQNNLQQIFLGHIVPDRSAK